MSNITWDQVFANISALELIGQFQAGSPDEDWDAKAEWLERKSTESGEHAPHLDWDAMADSIWRAAAQERVDETPELQLFEDSIIYEWDNANEYWPWVVMAPAQEIIDWAKAIAP